MKQNNIGTTSWNNNMFQKHPTPYHGIAGFVEYQRTKKILRIIKKCNYPKSNVIEIGCEQGNLLKYIVDRCPDNNYFGTDISDIAIQDARTKLRNKCTLIIHDITSDERIPNLPEIDILICSEVLEHIPNFEKAIRNISELVTSKTLIIITVPLEKYKNKIKARLTKMGLFSMFFKSIETGMSEWHVNDFSKKDILEAMSLHFDVINYNLLLGLHQIIVLKKRMP